MDTQLLQYRLKSARRKKRLQIEDRDKQLLKLDREQRRIRKNPNYKTKVPLDEPYQKGWKRLFVLKPEIQRSDKAEFYQGILNKINTVQHHYDKSFKKPRRKGQWHKYHYDELPKLKRISQLCWQADEYKLTDEQCACFQLVEFWDQQYYRWDYGYEFTLPQVFQIAVKPHFIETIIIGDALLDQRLSWIENHIYSNNLQCRLDKLKNGNRYSGWKNGYEKLRYTNPLKNKPKWEVFDL